MPLLVGQPFTDQNHIIVIRRRDTIRLFEEQRVGEEEDNGCLMNIKIPSLPERPVTLWAKTATVIPPNYVGFVELVTDAGDGDYFVDNQYRFQEGYEYCFPRCIISSKGGRECFAPIMNVSDRILEFKSGEKMFRAECCQEDHQADVMVLHNQIERLPIEKDEIHVGPSVTTEQQEALYEVISEYRDCFALNVSELER